MTRLLIVDDEPHIRSGLQRGLKDEVETIKTAGDVNSALDLMESNEFDALIADVRLPGDRDGMDLVQIVAEQYPRMTVIVITAHGTVEMAVEAMRRGAFDFITKPVDLDLIRQQVRRAIEHGMLREENHDLRTRLADAGEIAGIIGKCTTMQELFSQVRQVADTDATVLIQGESGTGKELVARALHDLSGRSESPFVAVNLGAVPETLLESELFGFERGAFTDANRQKKGCFDRAGSGTLFLDEITEVPGKCQVDLLRVLESGEYNRIGGEATLHADARIVSATNRDPQMMIEEGTFREDLFYRLNIVPLHIPPLRNRREDIPLLVDHFLAYFCSRHGREAKRMDDEAMKLLIDANWPGNVRQLRNIIERLVVTVSANEIKAANLPNDLHSSSQTKRQGITTLAEAAESAERAAIEAALKEAEFHRERAAKLLGVSVRTLHYKMSRFELH
ncbi:sigma-54-dependent transcriptional regulator [Crateriforma conspicua]|uniref:Nitrogen assimilation regulatory protein n=1 Tax=Crateriforma conspicua TaxID=2527996 RepID=A0A5C5XRE1_9PLAN|nr:sigma-54 dependent transcriptional regulator [Crateriforma conspicua]TWT65464.1 Nitrogen assimilation regulatory protein [Crateriforma conspicua]